MKTNSKSTKNLPPLAKSWLTPGETAKVKAKEAEKYGQRAFKVDPASFFSQFVEENDSLRKLGTLENVK